MVRKSADKEGLFSRQCIEFQRQAVQDWCKNAAIFPFILPKVVPKEGLEPSRGYPQRILRRVGDLLSSVLDTVVLAPSNHYG